MATKRIRSAKLPKIGNFSSEHFKKVEEKEEKTRADFIPLSLHAPTKDWRKFTITNIDQIDPHALVQAMVGTFGLAKTKDCWEHYCDLKEMIEEINDEEEN